VCYLKHVYWFLWHLNELKVSGAHEMGWSQNKKDLNTLKSTWPGILRPDLNSQDSPVHPRPKSFQRCCISWVKEKLKNNPVKHPTVYNNSHSRIHKGTRTPSSFHSYSTREFSIIS
jgi:hypothetical protein